MRSNDRRRFSQLSYRTRALLNAAFLLLGVFLLYAIKGFPYLNWEQDLEYTLRRSLAANAEILYSARVPEGCGTWSDEAAETVYLVREGESVGAMRMMRKSYGNSVFGGPNRYVQKYPLRSGMAIIPLHGAFPSDNWFCGMTVAIVPLDPAVKRVEVTYCSDSEKVSIYPAEQTEEGIFLSTFRFPGEEKHLSIDVYDDLLAWNCLGAIAYDAQGGVLSAAKSVWEEYYDEA